MLEYMYNPARGGSLEAEMREFTIKENDAGQRLDKFMTKLMPRLPKSMLYKGLRKKCVRLNGRHVKDGSVQLSAGDVLDLYFKDEFFESDHGFKYVKPELDIVYEDDSILIVNKAAGIVCHADERGTEVTLVDMVKSYLYDKGEYVPSDEQTFSPALCNRLDRNTGGLVIAAKNAAALRAMNEHIRSREVKKLYMAVVEGEPKERGRLEGYAERDGKVTRIGGEGGKRVSLDYRVIARANGCSLVEVELHTGRTHQIRAQFADAGFPLSGDTKYGGHGKKFRQALWSVELRFEFPADDRLPGISGRRVRIKAPFEETFV